MHKFKLNWTYSQYTVGLIAENPECADIDIADQ